LEKDRGRLAFTLFVVLVLGLVYRLILTTVFNEPFSTDVWPLIKISRKLLENTSIRIFDDRFFDGYNNRWPGVVLSTAMVSVVTGLDIFAVYRYLCLAIVITVFSVLLYTLLRTFYRDREACSRGLLYFLSVASLTVFSSSLLKEVYSYPFLYILIIYTLKRWNSLRREVLPILLASMALVVSHYFVTLIAIGILGSTLLVYLIARLMGFAKPSEAKHIVPQTLFVVTILSLIFAAYYSLHGYTALRIAFTVDDLVAYMFYSISIFGSYAVFSRLGKGSMLRIAILSMLFLPLVLAIAFGISVLPGIEVRSATVPYYVAPVVLPLALFLSSSSGEVGDNRLLRYLMNGVFLFIAINVMFIVFSKPELSTAFHRVASYIVLANTVLIVLSSSSSKGFVRRFSRAIPIIAAVLGGIVLVSIAVGVDDLVFMWSYREGEVKGFSYAINYSDEDITLCGDVKLQYYASIDRGVDVARVLRAIYTGYDVESGSLVVLHRDNYLKGYMAGLNIYRIDIFIEKLINMQKIYDNSYVDMWLGR